MSQSTQNAPGCFQEATNRNGPESITTWTGWTEVFPTFTISKDSDAKVKRKEAREDKATLRALGVCVFLPRLL